MLTAGDYFLMSSFWTILRGAELPESSLFLFRLGKMLLWVTVNTGSEWKDKINRFQSQCN